MIFPPLAADQSGPTAPAGDDGLLTPGAPGRAVPGNESEALLSPPPSSPSLTSRSSLGTSRTVPARQSRGTRCPPAPPRTDCRRSRLGGSFCPEPSASSQQRSKLTQLWGLWGLSALTLSRIGRQHSQHRGLSSLQQFSHRQLQQTFIANYNQTQALSSSSLAPAPPS